MRFKAQFLFKMSNIKQNGRKQKLSNKLDIWVREFAESSCHQREGESTKKFEERKRKLVSSLLDEFEMMIDKK